MSRESDFATRMRADTALMAILLGGVFESGAVGVEGITREAAPTAFDANSYLKACSLVRERGRIPDGNVLDPLAQITSTVQQVELWIYSDSGAGYTAIDAALDRLYTLFQGYQFSDSLEVFWSNTINRQRDQGALAGSSLARIDFAVYEVVGD